MRNVPLLLPAPQLLDFTVIQRALTWCEVSLWKPHHGDADGSAVESPHINCKSVAIRENSVVRERKVQPAQFEFVLSIGRSGRFLI